MNQKLFRGGLASRRRRAATAKRKIFLAGVFSLLMRGFRLTAVMTERIKELKMIQRPGVLKALKPGKR